MAEHDVEKVARAILAVEAGGNPDEKIHWPGEKSFNIPTMPRWRQYEDAARAAIAAMGDGWQDIASAPRDGTRVLLMLRGPKPPEVIARWTCDWTAEDDDEFEWVNDDDDAIYGTPTHWVALPPPPGKKP